MGRRLKALHSVIAALCSAVILAPLNAAAADISVEQTQCVMPEIRVYLHADSDIRQEQAKAFLDSQALPPPEIQRFSETKEPVRCCVLLDNSGSVPKKYVQPIRDAVTNLGQSLRVQDSLCIYTVGESVRQIYDGSGKDEALAEALKEFQATEQETVLFEALIQCAKDIQKSNSTDFVRSTALVFSDGVNEAAGAAVYDEAVQKLQDVQLPVYAFGLGTNAEGLDSFGQLARATGGAMQRIQPAETDEALQNTVSGMVDDDYVVKLHADSNELGKDRELTLQIGGVTKNLQFTPYKWVPDDTPPEILTAEQTAQNIIQITFSEDVRGADDLSHYLLQYQFGEKSVALGSVRYVRDNGMFYALLEPENVVTTGKYTLKLLGITDVSQEKNPLAAAEQEIYLRGLTATESYGQHTAVWLIPLLLVAGLLGVSFIFLRKKPQGETAQPDIAAGLTTQDYSSGLMPADNGGQQIHVRNPEGVPRMLSLTVCSANAAPVALSAVIENSLIFGRAAGKCNVSFDDPAMSRTHFRLDVRGNTLWITDCGSTSGTKVNGALLTESQQLSQGDVIVAGVTEITVRW